MSSPPRRPSPIARPVETPDAPPASAPASAPSASPRRPSARSVAGATRRVAATQRATFRERAAAGHTPTGQLGADGRPLRRRRETPYWLTPTTWAGSLVIMVMITAVLWIVQLVNAANGQDLDRFGLRPRHASGLWGIVTMPFLHANYHHLASNTAPFVLIGWVVLAGGLRTWAATTAFVVLVGGLLTWLVGPGDTTIVGASALVFGWLGYLLARAFFQPRLRWILAAVITLVFFGTLLYGLVPAADTTVSWQAHVCGFGTGLVAGAVLHPRGGYQRRGLPGRGRRLPAA